MTELLFKKLLAFQYSVFIVLLGFLLLHALNFKRIGGGKKVSYCF